MAEEEKQQQSRCREDTSELLQYDPRYYLRHYDLHSSGNAMRKNKFQKFLLQI